MSIKNEKDRLTQPDAAKNAGFAHVCDCLFIRVGTRTHHKDAMRTTVSYLDDIGSQVLGKINILKRFRGLLRESHIGFYKVDIFIGTQLL